jgi:hypothetical protein
LAFGQLAVVEWVPAQAALLLLLLLLNLQRTA